MIGTLQAWFDDRGYGFVSSPEGDIFVHRREAKGDRRLAVGTTISFEVAETDKGRTAYAVHVVTA